MADNDNPLLASEAPEPRTLGQRIGRFFGEVIVKGVIGTVVGGAVGAGYNAAFGGAAPVVTQPGADSVSEGFKPETVINAGDTSTSLAAITGAPLSTGLSESVVEAGSLRMNPPTVDVQTSFETPSGPIDETIPLPSPELASETKLAAPTMTGGTGSYTAGSERTSFNGDANSAEQHPLRVVSTDGKTVMPLGEERNVSSPTTAQTSNSPTLDNAWNGAKTGMKYGAGVGAGVGALKSMIVGPHTQREHDRRIAAAQIPGQGMPTP